jgi:hypothetical protein
MDLKKTLGALLALILLLSCACPALADGAAEKLEVEQVEICLPQIDVYFHPLTAQGASASGFSADVADVAAVLGNQALAVDALEPYTGGTAYYFLLDVSGSIPESVFAAIKQSIAGFIGGLKDTDAVVLITFGEQVTTVLDGTESRNTALDALTALEADDNITRFYDALAAAIGVAQSDTKALPSRRVALVFTDGKDVSEGGSTTAAEAGESLVNAGLPLYAFGIGSNKSYLDALGALARGAGGSFAAIDAKTCADALDATRERIDSCYVLRLRADSNIIESAEQQLIIKLNLNGKTLSVSKTVRVDDWTPDLEAPCVEDLYISGAQELTLAFSEAVLGAGDAANYSVTMTPSGGAIEPLAVQNAAYDDAAHTVKLTFAQPLYTGDYDVSIINITDRSMEKNPLATVSVHGGNLFGQTPPTAAPEGEGAAVSPGASSGSEAPGQETVFPLWLVFALGGLLAVIAVFVVIVASKKKPQQEGEAYSASSYAQVSPANTGVHIPGAAGVRCQALVLDTSGVQRKVEFTSYGTYTVGRSRGACDMAVDDKKLSRCHFRLTFEQGRMFIEDLGSTNGTEVNGVPIGGRRALAPTDTVTAGSTKFSFAVIG